MLIVSTLTQACFNFDSRRPAGNQVLLFSCGGRADGGKQHPPYLWGAEAFTLTSLLGGEVTNSQLFAFSGGAGPLSLQPQDNSGSCLVAKGNAIDVVKCNNEDAGQSFTFGAAAVGGAGGDGNNNNNGGNNGNDNNAGASTSTFSKTTRTVIATPPPNVGGNAPGATLAVSSSAEAVQPITSAAGGDAGTGGAAGSIPTANPTEAVPVSRAGGTLQPTAAAESHQRDETAKRAFTGVSIRAPDGQCLFVDPTAGDFRQNLIPVSLVKCSGTPNEKWDIITEGKHNKADGNQPAAALVISALVRFVARRISEDGASLTEADPRLC